MVGLLSVGNKVWFSKSLEETCGVFGRVRPERLKKPMQKKITQVVNTKRGILYQVNGGHFHESVLGTVVFKDYESAYVALIEENLSRGDIAVTEKDILKLPLGLYVGYNSEGNQIWIEREVGYGFTYKVDEGKPYLWCIDYDEHGRVESSYPHF